MDAFGSAILTLDDRTAVVSSVGSARMGSRFLQAGIAAIEMTSSTAMWGKPSRRTFPLVPGN